MIKTADEWIDKELREAMSDASLIGVARDAFNDGYRAAWEWGCTRISEYGDAQKRLKAEVTRLNDRVRALKHENNKLRKELWQRKESK